MDNFRKKFTEEAGDHINDLEKALLQLEEDVTNKELIEQIFRAMHSLKGGGAMFGFEKLSEFTHNLETIYDCIRSGKIEITRDLLSLTLSSVDHIKILISNEEELDSLLLNQHENLINSMNKLLSGIESGNMFSVQPKVDRRELEKKQKIYTYYIHFVPNSDIFNNGTNPLYLIDEISSMGESIILPNVSNIPPFEDLSPLKCYVSWEIIIACDTGIDALKDVFIFVETECFLEVERLSNSNLIQNKKFNAFILDFYNSGKELGLVELQNNISNFERSVSSKVKKVLKNRNSIITKDNSISSIRVASDKLDNLMNLVSELVTTQARLSLFAEQGADAELNGISENVQKLSKQLRDITFSIVLIPVETMVTRFQRLVRDLSNELKKQIRFVAEGVDTELDKTIIENLTDPLLHILRNCIDHGIELPEERIAKGKDPEGTIIFKAFYSGANVHIQIIDDGNGIDTEFILNKAKSKGLIAQDAVLSKSEILELIFVAGFSTAKTITDVSGRGVGMDVVMKKINGIRGDVEVESEVGEGTTVTIKLPLTLSIIDGLLVQIADVFYVIPLAVVEKIYAVKHSVLEKSFNNIIALDGVQYPYFYLRDEFNLESLDRENEQIIIIKYNDKDIGLTVDDVIGEYQAVLKPLGRHYKNQEIISGATILGDGTIALVIDTNKAIKFFTEKKVKINEKV